MKKTVFTVIFLILFLAQVFQVSAQSSTTQSTVFDMTDFPQWAKDARRFDVIAFGSFPFSWLFVKIFYDFYRWSQVGYSDNRYAPWSIFVPGAAEMTGKEYKNTILMASSLSVAFAITDLIIVKIRRNKQRRRIESRPAGSVIINKTPYGETEEDDSDTSDAGVSDEPNNTE